MFLISKFLVPLLFIYSNMVFGKAAPGGELIKLAYDANLSKEGFPSPILKATVGSKATGYFLIDTGASSNVLASWYAKDLPKDKKSEMDVPDSTGHMVKITLVKSDLKIDSKILKGQTFLVTELPPDFEKNKIAGIISPKALSSVIVLDLKTPQLSVGDSVKGMQKAYKVELIPRKQQTTCVAPTSSLYAIDVTVGQHATKLLVDSGSATTKIFLRSKIGQLLKPTAQKTGKQASGISGNKVDLLELPSGPIRFADYQTTSSILLQDADGKGCPSDGLLGMDLLRHCILIMAKDDIGISCQ